MTENFEDEIDNYFYGNDESTIEEEEEIKEEIKNDDEEEIIVGIDLGTSNSAIAIWRNKNLEMIPDEYGNKTIPSVVAVPNVRIYTGIEAKNQIILNPENTFYEVKRLIGRKIDEESVQHDKKYFSFKINNDEKDNIILESSMGKKNKYTPEEISSMILIKLKNMAEDYLKKKVTKAVVTVPAYFNDAQRQATKDAAIIAGLDPIRIINEPTAAALAYGFEQISINRQKDINIVVYDIGGGTTDCSLLNISDGMFQVLASTGCSHLGGSDFDNRLMSHSINEFKKKNKIQEIKNIDLMSMQKLKKSCENAKKILSLTDKAIIAVKEFHEDKNLYVTITKQQFEILCKDLFILCLKPVEDVLKSSNLERDDIDEIILVGGATRMPRIRENIKLFFQGKEPNCSINPDEVVAAGAAIQAYILGNNKDPFSENIVLLDVIPLSLGLEEMNEIMNILIPRNSAIPIKKKKKFTTIVDNETTVKVKVYEGERKMTKDNFLVGEFELKGIESEPRGMPEIEVTFCVDVNGIINVTAEDLKNNQNKNSITISANKGRLSNEEIKKLIEEAKEMALRDKIEREKKQLYYEIDDLCSNVQANINNPDFKLKEKDIILITTDIDKINQWLKEKQYFDRNKKDYQRILKKIKEKYGTLILRVTNENENVKNNTNNDQKGTTVYGNESDEELIYEKIENEEFGISDEEIKKELKQLKENLIELCYSIFDIISSKKININNEHIEQLKDYIDDIILWVHVSEKITKDEYINKIEEINKNCNDIMSTYNESDLFKQNDTKTKKEELQQLCYTIMSSIMSNVFSLQENQMNELKNKINKTLDWLIECDIETKRAELEDKEYFIDDSKYQIEIDNINELCNNLYNSMLNIDLQKDNIIDDNIQKTHHQINSKEILTTGMTIQQLKDKNQLSK